MHQALWRGMLPTLLIKRNCSIRLEAIRNTNQRTIFFGTMVIDGTHKRGVELFYIDDVKNT
jgi:hypothetical protein